MSVTGFAKTADLDAADNEEQDACAETMDPKYLYVHTMGCQMNVYDTGLMKSGLETLHYRLTPSIDSADLIILNTCAVREKAQQKAFSFLGRTARLKREKPELIIGVGGCVAQQEGENILKQMPHIDFVFGTHAIGRLPEIISRIERYRCRVVDTQQSGAIDESIVRMDIEADQSPNRFVTIMQGCDNFCSYCVVPFVRGREASRHPHHILDEIQRLVAGGAREVTLLGQNVNSYGCKEGLPSFAGLLSEINKVEGLLRIRFTTSHPKDLSPELMNAFNRLGKLCPHIHLPVQSGSNRILKRMNRKYTREEYEEKVEKLREACPGITITSDFIVGFPGETDDDFKQTLDIVSRIEFDNIFAFSYSDRPFVPSARLPGKIEESLKNERLQELLSRQKAITLHKNQDLVGSCVEVLVDGFSKKQAEKGDLPGSAPMQWTGRTGTHKIVNFTVAGEDIQNPEDYTGRILMVQIKKAMPHSLRGHCLISGRLKGEDYHAA